MGPPTATALKTASVRKTPLAHPMSMRQDLLHNRQAPARALPQRRGGRWTANVHMAPPVRTDVAYRCRSARKRAKSSIRGRRSVAQ
eukprot:scaffold141176_cov27-Tisochrysis_lutea.AAC.4